MVAGTWNNVDDARCRCSFARFRDCWNIARNEVLVLEEIFAGLVTVGILLAVGVLLLASFLFLREVWLYCLHWATQGLPKEDSHGRRDSRGGALLGVDSQQGRRRSPRSGSVA
jgi:hypothetical protein